MHFSGEYFKTLDDKGRLSIPCEFRESLTGSDNQLVLTKNMEGGLTAFPTSEWDEFTNKLENLPASRQRNALNRLYLAPKTHIQIDKQGRIPLSQAQRKWLGLTDEDRNIVLVGNYCRIDMFSTKRYLEVVSADVALIKGDGDLNNMIDLP